MATSNWIGIVDLSLVDAQLQEQSWSTTCPRVEVGLVCMKDAYDCVCSLLERYKAVVGRDRWGRATQLVLLLECSTFGGTDSVIEHLNSVPFAATIGVNGREVEVLYDLTTQHNGVLAATVRKRVG